MAGVGVHEGRFLTHTLHSGAEQSMDEFMPVHRLPLWQPADLSLANRADSLEALRVASGTALVAFDSRSHPIKLQSQLFVTEPTSVYVSPDGQLRTIAYHVEIDCRQIVAALTVCFHEHAPGKPK
jgi:hypothetical protein